MTKFTTYKDCSIMTTYNEDYTWTASWSTHPGNVISSNLTFTSQFQAERYARKEIDKVLSESN